METMGDRLRKIRKKKGGTQTQFGERIGVTDTAISKLEKNERNFTDQMIISICREFEVNEDWLRYGTGGDENMFEKDDIADLVIQHKLDPVLHGVLKTYKELPESQRNTFNDVVHSLAFAIVEPTAYEVREHVLDAIHDAELINDENTTLMDSLLASFGVFGLSKRYFAPGEFNEDEHNKFYGIKDDSEFSHELSEEEEVALVRKRHADKKRGLLPSTTSESYGQEQKSGSV